MNTPANSPNTPNTLKDLLSHASGGNTGSRKIAFFRKRGWRWGVAAVALTVILYIFLRDGASSSQMRYVTEKAEIGSITVSVSASGSLQPIRAVDVGSELSGTLESVLVRENDRVKKGQLLAQLDTSKLKDAVLKSRAAVISAEARVAQMEATQAESRASLSRMRQVAALSGGKVPAQTELESAEAAVKRAEANLKSALADVSQARATLKTDETNIRKAAIASPVDGVVLARKVEPGQTVAAAMTTPVLFNIAEDLTQMELHVNVDEADVAQVVAGQEANFTVSAWNGRKFPARVARVDLGSTLTDNVVTYTTVLEVANNDLALRPGMTASAEIITARRDRALLVPSAALRFTPVDGAGPPASQGFLSRLMPRFPRSRQAPRKRLENGANMRVWVLENGQPRPIPLKIGVTNGRYAEVLEGELKADMAVITGREAARP
ncbi:MAG: efflux RND transporter periplasmic adaptor subunit [Zoogloeaceae bacterium]|jgi:HlyD family secretion protein|nr:efflux RND transporter periplasmic adaptor subunit [Zoogloeaceae bacterium]